MGLMVSDAQMKIINQKKRKLQQTRNFQKSDSYKESRKKRRKLNKNPTNNKAYGTAKFQDETIQTKIKAGKEEMD